MKVIKQDITEETSGLIIHGVNCQQAMGSGVALAIKTKWPIVYTHYMARPKGAHMLGVTDLVRITDDLFVGNCYTQEYFGSDGKRYADLGAVSNCLREAFLFSSACSLELKLPKIASHRGGLDWDTEILPIISSLEQEFPEVIVTLYVI